MRPSFTWSILLPYCKYVPPEPMSIPHRYFINNKFNKNDLKVDFIFICHKTPTPQAWGGLGGPAISAFLRLHTLFSRSQETLCPWSHGLHRTGPEIKSNRISAIPHCRARTRIRARSQSHIRKLHPAVLNLLKSSSLTRIWKIQDWSCICLPSSPNVRALEVLAYRCVMSKQIPAVEDMVP